MTETTHTPTDQKRHAIDTMQRELITETSIKAESKARISRIDEEFNDGFKIIDKYTNTVTIFGSARLKEGTKYYQAAHQTANELSKAGYTIVTGGSGGIMEAGNRGAYDADGQSIGFNIELPHEQSLNTYTTESMPFHYFFARKVLLAYGSKGYICFPGGFGTMDEFFEVLTLIQTHKMPAVPIILYGKEFWSGLDDYIKQTMIDGYETVSKGEDSLYTIVDSPEEVVAAMEEFRRSSPQLD